MSQSTIPSSPVMLSNKNDPLTPTKKESNDYPKGQPKVPPAPKRDHTLIKEGNDYVQVKNNKPTSPKSLGVVARNLTREFNSDQ
jgi:hypothetical protein